MTVENTKAIHGISSFQINKMTAHSDTALSRLPDETGVSATTNADLLIRTEPAFKLARPHDNRTSWLVVGLVNNSPETSSEVLHLVLAPAPVTTIRGYDGHVVELFHGYLRIKFNKKTRSIILNTLNHAYNI